MLEVDVEYCNPDCGTGGSARCKTTGHACRTVVSCGPGARRVGCAFKSRAGMAPSLLSASEVNPVGHLLGVLMTSAALLRQPERRGCQVSVPQAETFRRIS